MNLRVTIQWTETARRGLSQLPRKVRQGLLVKADALLGCDPRQAHKPLTGPLQDCYRIAYARYRAIYMVQEEVRSGKEVVLHVKVLFVVVGQRKERDKHDIDRLAEKLVKWGLGGEPRP